MGRLSILCLPAQAAPRVGEEFQVNTYTNSLQAAASVSNDASGNFVVVWESLDSAYADTASRSIQGQRYDASGVALGSQFQINSTTSGDQYGPDVARSGGGAFIVVWTSATSAGSDASGRSIQGQRYAAPREVPMLSPIALVTLGGALLAAGSAALRSRQD